MDIPQAVSAQEWRAARQDLLAREKEVTRAKDAVDAARRELPVTEVTTDYTFTGPGGQVEPGGPVRRAPPADHLPLHVAARRSPGSLAKIRAARPARSWPTASAHLSHLHACDTTLVLVSRAPIASIERFRKRMGWAVPWYSSYGSDFNYDFHASFDEGKAPLEYNYKDKETLAREAPYIRSGADGPGVSVFLRDGDRVFHTYSAYERGLDSLLGTYRWLELTPLGRQRHVIEFPYHDTYDQEP